MSSWPSLPECPFVNPVDAEVTLGEKPCAFNLHERVEMTERSEHQSTLPITGRSVMGKTIRFADCAISRQRENCALSVECVVASYFFSSEKTGASASREFNSCEGHESFAFI